MVPHPKNCCAGIQVLLKRVQGRPVSTELLTNLCADATLPLLHVDDTSQTSIVNHLKSAHKHLTLLQHQHKTLCASFLEDLAEAIVIHQSPNLSFDSLSKIKKERSLKQLKQLQFREKMRRLYKKIWFTLEPPTQLGLSQIDIPDNSVTNWRFGDPANPKTWSGPWRSITRQTDIAQVVKQVNITQYHQAFHTPFGSGPLAQAIGRNADSTLSKRLLAGQLDELPLESLMPETIRILRTLASLQPTLPPEQVFEITDSDFISAYKCLQEDTSSSPSGRHVGHYKVILDDPNLVSLHATMMTIPFAQGFIPPRWTKITDIML
jgi:hypothetical protein